MKLDDIQVGMLLRDRWWPESVWRVVEKTANAAIVQSSPDTVTRFDRAHCQFLERAA